jgi:transcriptional regulator with XRE-family HTH domain
MQSVQDIRDKAKANGIRMNAVCREAGIQPPQVSRWLAGSVSPLWVSVKALSQALDRLVQVGEAGQGKTQAPSESRQPETV